MRPCELSLLETGYTRTLAALLCPAGAAEGADSSKLLLFSGPASSSATWNRKTYLARWLCRSSRYMYRLTSLEPSIQ